MKWSKPTDLRIQVQKLWENGKILRSVIEGTALFPKRLILKKPSSRDLPVYFDEVRHWIGTLKRCSFLRIEMQEIQHRVIGTNLVPQAVWVDRLEDALHWIGKQEEMDLFVDLLTLTRSRQPKLIEWIQQAPLKALSLANEWTKLLDIVDWLQVNPNPQIYLRQVDLPDIDTKFIEKHRSVLSKLLDLSLPAHSIFQDYNPNHQFSQRYGFLEKPLRIRFRILDDNIPFSLGANQDITVPKSIFAALDHQIQFQKVFIVENEITYLSFPKMKQSLLIFGSGYGFDTISNIVWLSQVPIFYWGDLDTHGFAILNQLRSHYPQVQSFLMDQATLLAHQTSWGKEGQQSLHDLSYLTKDEEQMFNDLRHNRFAPKVRLEQELVGFQWVLDTLKKYE